MMRGVLLAKWLLMTAFSLGHAQEAGRLKCEDTTKLERDDPIRQRLSNTVRLPGPCSGSLVIFEGRTASEKALVLTAGHCTLRAPGPGQVLKNLKQERALAINTLKFEARKACAATSVLLYATMTDIDIALYELTESYQELQQRTGAVPFVVSRESIVPPNTKLRAPSGHHENEQACVVDADVQKVTEYVWTWGPLMRLGGCTFIGGASGSPLISENTGQVVGVVSTVFSASDLPCSSMNPCEVDANGRSSVRGKGTSYGQYAPRLAACVNSSGHLDLSAPTCGLPK
jgi:V8-like Glu-specific endopeptidase